MSAASGWRPAALAAALAAAAAAQEPGWSLELQTEPSRVEIGARRTTWWNSQLLAQRRDDRGGLFLSAGTQQRGDQTDTLLAAGGYRRSGPWTFWLQGAAGLDPAFVARAAVEAQVARRVLGGFHAALGVQHLDFPAARVKLAAVAGFYYFPEGELELRLRYGRNETFDHAIQVRLFRWLLDRGGDWAFGGTLAEGRNLFDALAVPVEGGRGWTANLNLRRRFDARTSIRFDVGLGREAPAFRQRLFGIAVRRAF